MRRHYRSDDVVATRGLRRLWPANHRDRGDQGRHGCSHYHGSHDCDEAGHRFTIAIFLVFSLIRA